MRFFTQDIDPNHICQGGVYRNHRDYIMVFCPMCERICSFKWKSFWKRLKSLLFL